MAVAVKPAKPTRVSKLNKKGTLKNIKSNVLIVAQEIKFAKTLAGNDKKVRDKVLKRLRKWLTVRSQSSFVFTDSDFMRLWKGLFYCMWMSDKPLIQEDLAENLANLLYCFKNTKISIRFFKCFLQTMVNEWFGIDQLRLDKFLMLVRRVLRQCLTVISKSNWKASHLARFESCLSETVLKQNTSLGLAMHMAEIYIEEISKASGGNLNPKCMTSLLKPFAKYLSECADMRPITHVSNHVFRLVLAQSEAGQEHRDKFDAWRKQGFPGGNIDSMEKIEVSDEEEPDLSSKSKNEQRNGDDEMEELDFMHIDTPKDPRAGKVDVVLPQLTFDSLDISNMILSYKFNKETNSKSRKALTKLAAEFKLTGEGIYPLGIRQVKLLNEEEKKKPKIKSLAKDLIKFEQKLYHDKPTKLNKKQKKRKLKMLLEKETALIAEDVNTNNEDIDENIEDINDNTDEEDIDEIPEVLTNQVSKKKKKRVLNNVETKIDSNTNIKRKHSEQNLSEQVNNEVIVSPKKRRRSSGVWHVEDVVVEKTPEKETIIVPERIVSEIPKLLLNPYAVKSHNKSLSKKDISPKKNKLNRSLTSPKNMFLTPKNSKIKSPFAACSTEKRVKIMLTHNISQDTKEYERQLKCSPQIPYDAEKKPTKTLLKPNLIPSPINPFYKHENGI